jgi:hypothetical protein
VRQQSRSFALEDRELTPTPNSKPAFLRLSATTSQSFIYNFVRPLRLLQVRFLFSRSPRPRVIACYLKRRQTIANSTVAMIAVPVKKAQWKLNSRFTINSAEPGVCFPLRSILARRAFFRQSSQTYRQPKHRGWDDWCFRPCRCVA